MNKQTSLAILAVLLVAGVLFASRASLPARPAQPATNNSGASMVFSESALPLLGRADAPVKIVEFGDYQCPFCRKVFIESEGRIRQNFVEPGTASFAWKDFAFLGEESVLAAMAARCANDQGKFWAYHDLLFERQGGENSGAYSAANLKRLARELKLDGAAFDACFNSGKHREAVLANTAEGRRFNVQGTPTFFINGDVIPGALPYAEIEKVILKHTDR